MLPGDIIFRNSALLSSMFHENTWIYHVVGYNPVFAMVDEHL